MLGRKSTKAFIYLLLTLFCNIGFADSQSCTKILSDQNQRLRGKTFNVERILRTYKQSKQNAEDRKLLDAGFSTNYIENDQAEFYEYYRKFPKYLEEYSSKADRIHDSQNNTLITRFEPKYREVANSFLIQTNGKQNSIDTLSKIIQINQIILSEVLHSPHASISQAKLLSSNSRIQDLPKTLVGSPELRVSILIELEKQNKNINEENVLNLFKKFIALNINNADWKYLDLIVSISEGRINHQEAQTIWNQVSTTLKGEHPDAMAALAVLINVKKYFYFSAEKIILNSIELVRRLLSLNYEHKKIINLLKLQLFHPELSLNSAIDILKNIEASMLNQNWPVNKDHNQEQTAYIYTLLFLNEKLLTTPANDQAIKSVIQWQYQRYYLNPELSGPIWTRDQYLESLLIY